MLAARTWVNEKILPQCVRGDRLLRSQQRGGNQGLNNNLYSSY